MIYRWWNPPQAEFLAKLKSAIKTVEDDAVVQLLTVSFCRIVIELSNAAFNHVSTSFKDGNEGFFSIDIAKEAFISVCEMVAKGALLQPRATSKVLLHDSRSIPAECYGAYDTVITSPPYPNRISYIRELRPYMYWLDYLETSDQASDLDWQAIGGTWGRATSLLGTWKSDHSLPQYVYDIAEKISNADNKSAGLMANYVLKYFEDMQKHLSSVYAGLAAKGRVFYIIGNSNFYNITVPAEKIYVDSQYSAVSQKLPSLFLNTYSGLFMKGIEKDKLPKDADGKSFVDLYPNLFLKCLNNSDTLQINAISEDVLTTLIERLDMSQEHQQIFKKLFKENRMSEEAVQKLVVKLVPEMQDVFDYWANSGIALLTLTSVGIVIGAQYAKIITGQDYDLNIWI